MKKKGIGIIIFFSSLALMAWSNALAEVPDAFTMSWLEYRNNHQELFNLKTPVEPAHGGSFMLGGQNLYAQTQESAAGEESAGADSGAGSAFESADEAARQSSNPLGGQFFILLNQFDNYAMQGDITDKTRWINNWAFQPVVPIPMEKAIGENWIWVNRPTFNIVLNADLPDVDDAGLILPPNLPNPPPEPPGVGGVPFDSFSGFGDIIYFSMIGQSLPQQRWGGGDFVWAGGLTTIFPTASKDELGGGVYSIGPSGVLAFIGKRFIVGGLYQQWLSYAEGGNGSGDNQNFSWLNMFYFLNFEDGWQVGGTPVITADWEADSDDRWTVPIGLGVYKTHFFGKMPIKMGAEMQWMPVNPDIFGQEWNIRLVFAPVIPSFFK